MFVLCSFSDLLPRLILFILGELTRTISEVKAAIQSHEEGSARASSATDSELNESLVGKINNIISQIYQTKVAGQAGVYIDNILADYGYISD